MVTEPGAHPWGQPAAACAAARVVDDNDPGLMAWVRAHAPAGAHLRVDSRSVQPGDVFLALRGRREHGARYISAAAQRGAAAVLLEPQDAAVSAQQIPLPCRAVADLSHALGAVAAAYYADPTAELQTIGITGTNGKTSSCLWLAQILSASGQACASLGTLGFALPDTPYEPTGLTTPDAASVQRLARAARAHGAAALALEVSSIGLELDRVAAVRFAVAVFTNLTRDHLDFHGDMAAYAAAKRRLFFWPGLGHAVVNLDDAFGLALARELQASRPAGGQPALVGVGCKPQAGAELRLDMRLHAEAIEHRPTGVRFLAVSQVLGRRQAYPVETALCGHFNVANLLGVLGAAMACGLPLRTAAAAAAALRPPPGRMQAVAADARSAAEPLVFVDYAHTPDAIAQALHALRPGAAARGGRLWIVFGAGGDRDRSKRPQMAAAAAAADAIVLTSDNPRNEDPEVILDELAAGLPAGCAFLRQVDRAAAIDLALQRAAAADVVLIAGKGHEEYQELGDRRLPFADTQVARAALLRRRGASR